MIVDRIRAAIERDPAVHGIRGVIEVVLTYAGFHALLAHDLAHFFHARLHIPVLPRLISYVARCVTGIEIHPAARIGRGVFIDHGMGLVIGETAEVGDGCTIYQGVTLGGTGKQSGKRHPTIGRNVVLGVGAAVLGNVLVGDNSYVGAGAVVLRDVPPNSTAVGVPARMVKMEGRRVLGATLDHTSLPDPVLERLQALQEELERAEEMLGLETALPHVVLVVSAADRQAGRARVEAALESLDASFTVHVNHDTLRLSATLRERDLAETLAEIRKTEGLTIVSEGREPNLRGEGEQLPLLEGVTYDDDEGARRVKLIVMIVS